MGYRKLFDEEIGQLIAQGCSCENWDLIEVVEKFHPDHLIDVHFMGYNRIGCFDEEVTLFSGVSLKTGIFNATICNCTIENNALIKNIRRKISNCRIGERVVLLKQTEDKSALDNGAEMWMISADKYEPETTHNRGL